MRSESATRFSHVPTVTSKPLLAHLKKKNPQLYRLVLKLPEHDVELRQKYERLTTPTQKAIYVRRVHREKKSIQQKFDFIRQSIDSQKNDGHDIANEQIIRQCQTLKIKNVARKYSEYKVKEGLEAMQNKIKMQKRHRCLTNNWLTNTKKTRPKSRLTRKIPAPQQEDYFQEVKEAIQRCQERLNTQEFSAEEFNSSGNCWNEQDSDYGKARLVISESFQQLKKLTRTDFREGEQSEVLRNITNQWSSTTDKLSLNPRSTVKSIRQQPRKRS